MKTDQAIRRRIRGWARLWHELVGDQRFKLVHHWDNKYPVRAGCEVDTAYRVIHLYWNEKRLKKQLNLLEIMQEVLHEVVHAFAWPLIEKLEEKGIPSKERDTLEEGYTTDVERAIWRAYWSSPQQSDADLASRVLSPGQSTSAMSRTPSPEQEQSQTDSSSSQPLGAPKYGQS